MITYNMKLRGLSLLCGLICVIPGARAQQAQSVAGQDSQPPAQAAVSNPQRPHTPPFYVPFTEPLRGGVALGTGLQRVPERFVIRVGGGSSLATASLRDNAAFRAGGSFDIRYARMSLVLQAGGVPALRIEGQTQLLPVSLHMTPISTGPGAAATFFNLQIIPVSAQGQVVFRNIQTRDLGVSHVTVSPEVAAEIMRINYGTLGRAGVSLASIRAALGPDFGVVSTPATAERAAETTMVVGAPQGSLSGRIRIELPPIANIPSFGLEMGAQGRVAYDIPSSTLIWNANGRAGLSFGLPTGARATVAAEAALDGVRRGEARSIDGVVRPVVNQINSYLGGSAGVAF